ncbi:ABC transporter substrate-binding protein [Crenobacter oryzisoli]|uniref:ABC transporter substrate-binding protein n=1 Tax=Crenobacter oryzisoli TaxID=3056844 RepID=UPI003204F7A3
MHKKMMSLVLALLTASGMVAAADWSGKVIRLGIDPSYPPFEYKTPDGKLAGFGVDIAEALCQQMHAKCVWVENSWDGMIPALQAKKIDAIASSMLITPKRLEQIAFSNKISNSPSRLVAKRGATLQPTVASLKGKRIGVEQGSTQEAYAKAVWAPAGIDVVSYQNQDLVYNDLVSGRLDASLQSTIQADGGFLKKPIGKGFAFVGAALDDPKFFGVGDGIGLRKEDVALREDINKAIATIRANGTYKRINNKYFDFDIYGSK